MKKLWISSFLFLALASCGGNSSDNAVNENNTDSTGLTNPVTIDTTKHPTGMDNSNIISTDTAAMNTSNAYKKLDSVNQKKQ